MEINSIGAGRKDIAEMLSKIREVSNKSQLFADSSSSVVPTKSFDSIFSAAKDTVSHVGQIQTEADQLKAAYTAGDSSISMSQVVVASQKSKLAFEGLVTVRNKLLEAYREIMNMAV